MAGPAGGGRRGNRAVPMATPRPGARGWGRRSISRPRPLGGLGGPRLRAWGGLEGREGSGIPPPALRLGEGRGVPSGRPGGARPGRGFHPGGVWTRPRRRVAKVRPTERSTSQIRKTKRNRTTTHGSKRPQTENAYPGAHSLLRLSSQMGKLRKRPQTENASPGTHSLLRPGPPHFTDGETEAEQGGLQMAFARRSSSCGRGPPGAGESRSRLISEAGTRTPEQGLPGVGGTAEAQAPLGSRREAEVRSQKVLHAGRRS